MPEPAAPILPPRPHPVGQPTSTADIIGLVEAGSDLAIERSRPDLTEHLDKARTTLAAATSTVVVLGEFKRGKSTLINALLGTAVCPVDADIVTAVPTIVTYGESAGVTAYAQHPETGEMVRREMTLADLTTLVTEPADPDAPHLERSVEVRLPHRMLRAGLRLVDTPGVGGLDSAHGYLTLGTLSLADGALFVTDASQELTGPELTFLQTVVERCPTTALCVVKTDLYPEWRRIVEINRGHLADAGLELPVLALSSFLRLRATSDESLTEESGYNQLVAHLAQLVVDPGAARAAAAAAEEVEFVVTQLEERNEAERAVLAEPDQAPRLIAELRETTHRAASLSAPTASWQQTLADGIQDLVADVDHDLQERMRTVVRDVEAVIAQGDPKQSWPETEVWLRRQIAQVAVENRNLLIDRATELTAEVAGRFELDAGRRFEIMLGAPDRAMSDLPDMGTMGAPSGRVASMVLATRSAIYVPMVLFSVLSGIGWVAIGAGVAVALGAGIGQKIIRDEGTRQRTNRQQQAKIVARKFIDDVAFVLTKDAHDALRKTQRRLREDFQARASSIHISSQAALESAQQAAALDERQQSLRSRELVGEQERLTGIRGSAQQLARPRENATSGGGRPERGVNDVADRARTSRSSDG